MENRQIKLGAILSYAQMAINVIISLVYTPLMIRLLGRSEYGLYNTVSSAVSMMSILNLGFSSGYIRFFAKYNKKNDMASIYKLNGLFLIIFLILAFIVCLCGAFLTSHLHIVFKNGLTDLEYSKAFILMILLTIHLAVSFPLSVFSNIIIAHEKFIFIKILGIVKNVASPLLTIPLLLLGYGSIGIAVATLTVSFVIDVISIYYTMQKLKMKFVFYDFEKGVFKELFFYTSFIAINILVDQVNWHIDKILLGRYRGTSTVALYSVGATLQTYYTMFSSSLSGLFTPRIHKIVNDPNCSSAERNNKINILFVNIGRLQFLILGLISTGFIFFGKPFIGYWAGNEYKGSYYVALLLMLPVTIPLIQNLGIEIQRAQNKHQFRSIAYAVMALINFVISIYLAQKYGAAGAAFGTAISLIVANGFIMNYYYWKKMNINIPVFWRNIIYMSIGLIIPVIYGILIDIFIDFDTVWKLSLSILSYGILYFASMWFISMNKYEKSLVFEFLKRLANK